MDNEPVDLIMNYSATIYSMLEDTNIVNAPSTVDWFAKEDYGKVIEWIGKTKNKIVFDSYSYELLQKYCDNELNEILEEKFF